MPARYKCKSLGKCLPASVIPQIVTEQPLLETPPMTSKDGPDSPHFSLEATFEALRDPTDLITVSIEILSGTPTGTGEKKWEASKETMR
jgi:hypothetical protein